MEHVGVTRDNTQDIFRGAQVGLINLTQGISRDPELEQRIVSEVAGYGRQLGRLLEAVDVLARHAPNGLHIEDRAALDALCNLAEDVKAVRHKAAKDRAEKIIADVAVLCENPTENAAVLERLGRLLKPESSQD